MCDLEEVNPYNEFSILKSRIADYNADGKVVAFDPAVYKWVGINDIPRFKRLLKVLQVSVFYHTVALLVETESEPGVVLYANGDDSRPDCIRFMPLSRLQYSDARYGVCNFVGIDESFAAAIFKVAGLDDQMIESRITLPPIARVEK